MNTICGYESYNCDIDECEPSHDKCHEAIHNHPEKLCKWIEKKAQQEQNELSTEDMIILSEFVENETKFYMKYVENGRISNLSMAGPIMKFGTDSFSYILLGQYDMMHVWQWPWNMNDDPDENAISKEIFSNLPTKLQIQDLHQYGSHLIIKLLIAYLHNIGKFTHTVSLPYYNQSMLVFGCYLQ